MIKGVYILMGAYMSGEFEVLGVYMTEEEAQSVYEDYEIDGHYSLKMTYEPIKGA